MWCLLKCPHHRLKQATSYDNLTHSQRSLESLLAACPLAEGKCLPHRFGGQVSNGWLCMVCYKTVVLDAEACYCIAPTEYSCACFFNFISHFYCDGRKQYRPITPRPLTPTMPFPPPLAPAPIAPHPLSRPHTPSGTCIFKFACLQSGSYILFYLHPGGEGSATSSNAATPVSTTPRHRKRAGM